MLFKTIFTTHISSHNTELPETGETHCPLSPARFRNPFHSTGDLVQCLPKQMMCRWRTMLFINHALREWRGRARNTQKHCIAGRQMRANSEMPIWHGEQEAWSSTWSMPLAGTAWLYRTWKIPSSSICLNYPVPPVEVSLPRSACWG